LTRHDGWLLLAALAALGAALRLLAAEAALAGGGAVVAVWEGSASGHCGRNLIVNNFHMGSEAL
jgi:hypothetical protein